MAADLIRYDVLVQDALRGVVRKVLADMARDGLPGDHHFYISFRTHARGVRLSPRMRERYPDEMTIVLQHQFWDLSVTDQAFEVGLSFRNIPEMLLIPFEAITRFSDPSVPFDVKFEMEDEPSALGGPSLGAPVTPIHGPTLAQPNLAAAEKFRPREAAWRDREAGAGAQDLGQDPGFAQKDSAKKDLAKKNFSQQDFSQQDFSQQDSDQKSLSEKNLDEKNLDQKNVDEKISQKPRESEGEAKVVSIDAFRKKT